MPINNLHNRTPVGVWAKLLELIEKHPDARIVTTTNEHEGELENVIFDEKLNKIELVFD